MDLTDRASWVKPPKMFPRPTARQGPAPRPTADALAQLLPVRRFEQSQPERDRRDPVASAMRQAAAENKRRRRAARNLVRR